MELSQRKLKILASIIDIYIESGDPVGSKIIAEKIGVSSATIRNEMADLIEMGYLLQPHTSAGRVPSERGFREYLNANKTDHILSDSIKNSLSAAVSSEAFNTVELIKKAASALSLLTNNLVAVTEPDGRKAYIKAVQFVQISRRKAMLILISSEGGIKTKLFSCDYDLNHDIMRIFFRIFNERVTGVRINEIGPSFLQSLAISLGDMIALLSPALLAFYETVNEKQSLNTVLSGELNLLNYPEFSQSDVKSIINLLQKPLKIVPLESMKPGKANILLGSETGKQELRNACLISTPYEIMGVPSGSITLVGPMRMDFTKTAALLNHTASVLSEYLHVLMKEI